MTPKNDVVFKFEAGRSPYDAKVTVNGVDISTAVSALSLVATPSEPVAVVLTLIPHRTEIYAQAAQVVIADEEE